MEFDGATTLLRRGSPGRDRSGILYFDISKLLPNRYGDALLSTCVIAGIAAVAYADYIVDPISLSYLYVLPLALSALVNRPRTTMVLVLISVALHDLFGPAQRSWEARIALNTVTLVSFTGVVFVVHLLTLQRRRLATAVRAQRDELAQEIRFAAHVQRRLLPAATPRTPGFDVAVYMTSAKVVGGDFYDYVPLRDGNLGLVIGDVSGKGVAAALLMASVVAALRIDAPITSTTNDVARTLNTTLYEMTDPSRFATLFYGRLDMRAKRLDYTNAGHNPPALLRAHSRDVTWLETGGVPLGMFSAADYATNYVDLHPGDLVVLYTDGLVEAENARGEQFTRERLASLVEVHKRWTAREIVEVIRNTVTDFSGADSFEDDLTLIVLKAKRVDQTDLL